MKTTNPAIRPMGWIRPLRRIGPIALLGLALTGATAAAPAANPLVWDATEKTCDAKPGDPAANFAFTVRNTSDRPVAILEITTSCHCTTATPPRWPWTLAPGETGTLRVTIDLRSRYGALNKTVYIDASTGYQQLFLTVHAPLPPAVRRDMNLAAAQLDRQTILRGDCASCHVKPAVGRQGAELFQAACAICHGAKTRASMVPDLAVATTRRDAAYWRRWISEGRENTLMPAFARDRGGFLDAGQIDSLVAYLLKALPTAPAAK
jgi:cytochrome c553